MQDCLGGTTRQDGSCGSARMLPANVLSPDCDGSVGFEAAAAPFVDATCSCACAFVSLASSASLSIVLAVVLAVVLSAVVVEAVRAQDCPIHASM